MVYVNLLEGTFGCSIGAVFLLKSNKWTKDVYLHHLQVGLSALDSQAITAEYGWKIPLFLLLFSLFKRT